MWKFWEWLGGRTYVFIGASLIAGVVLAWKGILSGHDFVAQTKILSALFTGRAIADDIVTAVKGSSDTPPPDPPATRTAWITSVLAWLRGKWKN